MQIDHQRLGPVHALSPLLPPSPVAICSTQDSLAHLVDCRVGNIVADLKVAGASAGPGRVFCPLDDGNSVVIGHHTGHMSVIDIRTGTIRRTWKVKFSREIQSKI